MLHVLLLESDLLEEVSGLFLDFVEPGLIVVLWGGSVHLVDTDDDVSDTKSESE